jgi:hypothetical protein
MDGNRQENKQLIVKHKALKWARTNNVHPNKTPSWVPMVEGMIMTSLS